MWSENKSGTESMKNKKTGMTGIEYFMELDNLKIFYRYRKEIRKEDVLIWDDITDELLYRINTQEKEYEEADEILNSRARVWREYFEKHNYKKVEVVR